MTCNLKIKKNHSMGRHFTNFQVPSRGIESRQRTVPESVVTTQWLIRWASVNCLLRVSLYLSIFLSNYIYSCVKIKLVSINALYYFKKLEQFCCATQAYPSLPYFFTFVYKWDSSTTWHRLFSIHKLFN